MHSRRTDSSKQTTMNTSRYHVALPRVCALLTLLPCFFQKSNYAMGFLLPLVSKKENLPLFNLCESVISFLLLCLYFLEKQELLWNIIAHCHSDVKCSFLIGSYKTSFNIFPKRSTKYMQGFLYVVEDLVFLQAVYISVSVTEMRLWRSYTI